MIRLHKFITILLITCLPIYIFAGEGMWLPIFLKQLNEAEMQSMGMKMKAEDIYSVNKGSLKDAIVHFGGGCTGEIISSQGLLLTNHHCGYGQIQRHSTLENNYLEQGFWALTQKDELPNPELFVTFIVRMEDVTSQVLKGIKKKTSESERNKIIDQNIKKIAADASKKKSEDAFVRSFFHGNQYFLFVTTTFRDVRLVGTPPSSIGKYGADTDNWEWPRHTGDFALFRVYADKNNEPATYSPDNIPYTPKHFLPISMEGVEEGDFTLVFGFPGRTDQYLPAVAVELTVDKLNPAKIEIRDRVLKIMDAALRSDAQTKINYASKYTSIANAWKKWIGESQGLISTGALEKKRRQEALFQERVNSKKKLKNEYGTLLAQFDDVYKDYSELAYTRDYFSEVMGRNVDGIRLAATMSSLVNIYKNNGSEAFTKRWNALKDNLGSLAGSVNQEVDMQLLATLLGMLYDNVDHKYLSPFFVNLVDYIEGDMEKLASQYYNASLVSKFDEFASLVHAMSAEELIAKIQDDPMVLLYDSLMNHYNTSAAKPLSELQEQINALQKKYMKAQMEVFPEKRFWPDANSTLRVTYGKVEGYKPRDAVQYKHQTYLSGVIEKYQPGDYEFDLPKRLLDLHKLKNFGPYADKTGDVPVCFLGSNHTTGGNSGSPAIDARGNLVGLNFDRVWEGTMSDLNYDPSICRNIMVDVRYILFIIDKYANAKHLIKEMKLVYPKTGHYKAMEKMETIMHMAPTVD